MQVLRIFICFTPLECNIQFLYFGFDCASCYGKNSGFIFRSSCDYKGGSQFSSVQFSRSVVSDSLQPHESIAACQASLSITNSWSLPKLTLVMPSSHLILCCPLLLLPPIPPSIGVFSNESALYMRWPKYWSFSSDAHLFYDNDQIL